MGRSRCGASMVSQLSKPVKTVLQPKEHLWKELHLDPGITKGNLYYQDYLDLCIDKRNPPASYSYFMYIWSHEFGVKPQKQADGESWKIVIKDEGRKKISKSATNVPVSNSN
jgi:hypothetical protein